MRPQVREEHAARHVLHHEVQLGRALEGTFEPEDERVARLGMLAQDAQLDRNILHRTIALNGRLIDHLHRIDLVVEVAAYLEDLAVASLAHEPQ